MAPLSVPPARGRWDYDDDSDDPWIADSLRGSPQTDSGEQGSPQTDDGEQGSPQTNNGEWGDSQAGDNGCKGTSGADRKSRRLRTSRELSLLTESLTRVLGGENTAFDELLLEDPCLLDSEFVDGVDLQDVSVIADVIRSLAASRGMRARTVGSAQRRPREWGTRVPKSSLRSVFKAVKESRATSEDSKRPLCWFHITNNCRYGVGCRNRHGSKCRHCGLNCLDPENPTAAAAHQAGCKEAKRSSSEVKLSSKENDECPICLTSIKDSKKIVPPLEECCHCICYKCINTWRTQVAGIESTNLCPLCRQRTSFFFPSPVWPKTAFMKKTMMTSYISYLGSVPCKYQTNNSTPCPHGESCFFKHTAYDQSQYDLGLRLSKMRISSPRTNP